MAVKPKQIVYKTASLHLTFMQDVTHRIIPIVLLCLLVFMILRSIFSWRGRLHAAQSLRAKLQADSDAYAEAKAAAQATATGGSVHINTGPQYPMPVLPSGRVIALGQRTRKVEIDSEVAGELPSGKHFTPPSRKTELETIKRRRNEQAS